MPYRFILLTLAALAALLVPFGAAGAPKRKVKTPVAFPADWNERPSARYTALSEKQCFAELTLRKINVERESAKPGVRTPVRIPQGLAGIHFRTSSKPKASNPNEIFDCRLVLAMHDFAQILAKHDIKEVRTYSGYRPPGKKWPKGRLGIRHPGALAVDVKSFIKEDGTVLDVKADFPKRRGAAPCASLPSKYGPKAREIQSVLCKAIDAGLFTSALTPNFNQAHHNHYHLEIRPDVRWTFFK